MAMLRMDELFQESSPLSVHWTVFPNAVNPEVALLDQGHHPAMIRALLLGYRM